MTPTAPNFDISDEEQNCEQKFVDTAYSRLDDLRANYRAAQEKAHANHGVGNAQGFTERDVISSHFGDMAARLENVEDRLVFGRLDMLNSQAHYIGRTALSDTTGAPLLIDWRAPASRPYYQATAVDPQGVVRRRHLMTQGRQVIGLEDEALDTQKAQSQGLDIQGEGALMASLSQARSGHMTDIVSTIQAEQDKIIRAPDNGLIVVQGGPGTGKTAVALHRAAYLLYAERERLEKSGVLLVGPSKVFLRYIEKVLPSLGESGVVNVTLGDLLPGIHTETVDDYDIAELKGRLIWTQILRQAVKSLQRVPDYPQELQVWSRKVTLHPDDIRSARAKARRTGQPHNVAREGFALELMDILAKRLASHVTAGRHRDTPDPQDIDMWCDEIRQSIDARRAINLAWMPTTASTLLDRLLSKENYLASVNQKIPNGLLPEEISLVQRPKGAALTVSDIPLLDELEELLGSSLASDVKKNQERQQREKQERDHALDAIQRQNLGGGIISADLLAQGWQEVEKPTLLVERARADRSWTYGHILVDEAQELTPMAWHSLLRRCPSRSFTIVGDLDQRSGKNRPSQWKDALGPAARALTDQYTLTISYRTPQHLTELAERVMDEVGSPVLHPLTSVRQSTDSYFLTRLSPMLSDVDPRGNDEKKLTELDSEYQNIVKNVVAEEKNRLENRVGSQRGRIAVIVSQKRAHQWNADVYGYSGLNQQVSLITARTAKGLEFDTVILIEPNEILADGPGDLFVALTRATQTLHVLAAGPLPSALELPDINTAVTARTAAESEAGAGKIHKSLNLA